jgi:hypothetical protein
MKLITGGIQKWGTCITINIEYSWISEKSLDLDTERHLIRICLSQVFWIIHRIRTSLTQKIPGISLPNDYVRNYGVYHAFDLKIQWANLSITHLKRSKLFRRTELQTSQFISHTVPLPSCLRHLSAQCAVGNNCIILLCGIVSKNLERMAEFWKNDLIN